MNVKKSTDEVKSKQAKSISYLRQVTQALHQIAEKLAEKEINIDPRNFVSRETISRNIRLNMSNDNNGLGQSNNELFYSFIDGGS